MAAVLAFGPGAALSHRSAAALWRLDPRWRKPVDVTAPTRRRHPGIRVHRSQRLIAELDGYGFHNTKHAFETDRDRDADLLIEWFRTIRITYKRLEQNGTKEAKRLRALLAEASG